jgi:NADH:ubiquinone reductase (non-electrogenic)
MAGSTLAIRSKMASIMQLSSMSRRSISTSQLALRAKPLRSINVSQSVSRVARRSYADAAAPTPTPSPAPKPKKRFRALRWAWRLTWMSAIGLTGAVAYSIFDLRQPPDQSPPDPSKKTLVILGRFQLQLSVFDA